MDKFSDWLKRRGLTEGFNIRRHMKSPFGEGVDPVTVHCKSGLSFTVEEGPEPEGRDREYHSESRFYVTNVTNLSKPFPPHWPQSGPVVPGSHYEVDDWQIDDLVDDNGGVVDE